MAKIAEFYAELGLKKDKFDKGMKDAGKAPSKLGGVFAGLGVAIAGAFSVASITMFATASLKAYDAQVKAEAGLLQALKGRKDIQQALIEQANQMQRTTLFEDDTIIQAQKFLATMGLSATMIHDLLPLLADFSTSTGMDLVQAANLAGKAIGTSTNALGRYGVELDATMSKTEKASAIMEVFTERYGGQAKKAAEVGMSGLQQLNKAWGEIQEMIGARVGPFLNAIAGLMSSKLFDVTTGDPNQNAINEYLKATVEKRKEILKQYEWSYDEYKRLAEKYRTTTIYGSGKRDPKFVYYQDQADRVREFIGVLKNLEEETQGVIDTEGDIAVATEKLADPTLTATISLYKYTAALETAKFALEDFIAYAQYDAIKTYPSKLPGLEDEANVEDEIDTEKIFDKFNDIKEETSNFVSDMNMMLEGFVENFIYSFGDGLADVLTGDMGIKDFFNNILDSIGGFLQQMGAALIAYGVSIAAFEMGWVNPLGLIAAGTALVVIGGVISNLAAKGPDNSTAGMSGGGASGYSGSGYSGGGGMRDNEFKLTTEISGADLQLILERASRYSTRGGRG